MCFSSVRSLVLVSFFFLCKSWYFFFKYYLNINTKKLYLSLWDLMVNVFFMTFVNIFVFLSKKTISFAGVYTIDIDSKLHKVTVVGNVEVDALIKKLVKTGKHAEKWPENPTKKEKTNAAGESKDKGSESSGNSSDDEDNNNNKSNNNSNPMTESGNTPGKNGGPSVKFAGVPDNNPVQVNVQAGGGATAKKKKKKKKKKSAGVKAPPPGGLAPAPGGPADTGLVAPEAGTTQVVDQVHLSPPRGYSHPMPAYTVCYSETHPGGNGGPAYYIPPTPYTYDYTADDDDYVTSYRLSDTFEILSDENPLGCYVM